MKFTRTLALIVGTTLLLIACSKDSDDATQVIKENTNPLLAYVPADTAYVTAALEPIPVEITDAYIARFQPVLDVLTKQLEKFQVDYQSGNYQDNQMATLATAVLDELGGNVSLEGLEKLGITIQSHHALYAMGVFPVIRIQLTDAQQLRDAIARIEVVMGFEMPVKEFNGKAYWRVAQDDVPVGAYIAILDQQLVMSVFPVGAEDDLLASFLGEEMPEQSMASTNALAIMNGKKGYTGYDSGFLDLQKLSDEMLDAGSATRTFLGPAIDSYTSVLDDVCIAEIKSMIAKAPRMTAGVTKLSENEIATRYDLEIESSLAASLATLVSDTPVATDGNHLLSGSLAIQIGRLRNFVLEKANALVTSPYQCGMLQQLNESAAELATQLNIPMPPMINNLNGARIRVDDFDPASAVPQGSGLLAVHVSNPEMFVGIASMMVPGFDALDLANQSEPVKIPAEMIQMQDIDVFVLMSDNAIGASIGGQKADELGSFMAAKPKESGTFFSVSYDLAKQIEIQQAMSQHWGIDTDDGEYGSVNDLAEAIRTSYSTMLGYSRFDMSMTGDGLVIDSRMTFK